MVPHNERFAINSTLEWRVPLHPLPGLEEVIETDSNVGWSCGRRSATEDDGFTGGFQEVVFDFVRTILVIPEAAAHRMRIRTTDVRRAVKVAEIGIHDRHITRTSEDETTLGFILGRAVQPATIEHNVIRGASDLHRYQGGISLRPCRPRQL